MLTLDRQFLQNRAYDYVMERLNGEGFATYAVGGCVRDALLGMPSSDVDVATSARPHDLPKVFGTEPWDGDGDKRASADGTVVLYPTGVRHGTWTVRYQGDEVEVTTFRKDVATDGRNATVEFANSMGEDAERRDFTFNALYLDYADNVWDPTGTGVRDLYRGHVRFVGDAAERVQEDYLRILRLFRFYARFGRGPIDTEAFNAASKYRFGLKEHVSGERMWDETKKLLSLHAPFEACIQMGTSGVAQELFEDWDLDALGAALVQERLTNCAPRWSRRFVALNNRTIPFPCANAERQAVADLGTALGDFSLTKSQAVMAHEYGEVTAYDWAVLNPLVTRPNHAEITRGAETVFPVTGDDLMEMGYKPGKDMGGMLRLLKRRWKDSDMQQSKESLLTFSRKLVAE